MNLNTRTLGLAVLLLLLFLGAALSLQAWLSRETRQLHRQAIEETRGRLGRIIALSGLPPEKWDAYFQDELGAMVGGRVTLYPTATPPPAGPAAPGQLVFTEPVGRASGWEARVGFAVPALIRAQVQQQRILATIILLALLLALVPVLVAVLATRRSAAGDTATRTPWAATRAQATGFEQLARLSHERSTALAQEQGARQRAEEDLQVNRHLLDRSVAERVRLGRELHDNICQTLYAVCLTLESVQKKSALTPAMHDRTGQCLVELRRLNQEVRAYLQDLEPGRVNGQSFGAALAGMLGSLPAEDEARIERRLDPEAVELITSGQVAEIMNILREAVSNSLRHGRPAHIILRAARDGTTLALSVQDDGAGFSPHGHRGHGLDNMRARARTIGGALHIESDPGQGTRVILTLPTTPAA
ncbi:Sensor histidine kinase LiaS [Lacunisphaera limnophila]|uniref:Oxygen sensor histidine kinase NreB n=1 Tax=Lacunisphaera limnophila TaxID=1838286 RepID=A0A1D8AWV9_9BACT|nr:ATP-binding protein [Lacunisphaera limnophila]AOS45378.1 Sensor histidine kinase LiaS [Lacunisphaera limnophila]